MLKNPKPVKIEATGDRVDVEISANGGRRYYAGLYASGMVILGRQVRGNGRRITHVRDVDKATPLGRQLTQLAKAMVRERNAAALADAPAPAPAAAVLPGGGLILPPPLPAPPPHYVYLSPQGARNMAEELLRAARNVEAAMALAPDPYQMVEAGCNVRIRVGA